MNSFPSFNVFDDFAPFRRQKQQRCCNDPYCHNNTNMNQPRRRKAFDDLTFGSSTKRDPFFTGNFGSSFFNDDEDMYNSRKVRNTVRRPQTAQYHTEDFDNKENVVPSNRPSVNVQSKNKPKKTEPKFFSSVFNSSSVSKNGRTTTLNKEQYKDNKKSETFITKITEDKDGNRNVENLIPENYSQELKAIMQEMEESGAVIREIAPREDSGDKNSIKMIEENPVYNNNLSISSDNISNTSFGNNMF